MLDVAHGFHVFRDGSAWCAVGPHFVDLMQSDAGFGNTPNDAIIELHGKFVRQAWWKDKALPMRNEFTIHPGPNGIRKDCDRYEKCEEGVAECHCLDEART